MLLKRIYNTQAPRNEVPMRRILIALLLLAVFPVAALAAPFVIADSYTAPAVIPDRFRLTFDGGAEQVFAPFSGTMADGTVLANTVHFDLVGITTGAHAVSIKACKGDPLWSQEVCSVASPFSFAKPAPPAGPPLAPTGMTLKQ